MGKKTVDKETGQSTEVVMTDEEVAIAEKNPESPLYKPEEQTKAEPAE